MSRKFLVLLLVCAMCLSSLVACDSGTQPTATPGTQPTGTAAPTTEGGNDTTLPNDTSAIVNPFEGEVTVPKKEHATLETVPTHSTLVGSYSLPPIDNQGSVGSCASQSIAYTQFSNAVARYLNSIDSNSPFKPAENDKYCFSPKFTYTYSGAGTEWVYKILMDHGCLTLEDSGFYKIGTGSSLKQGASWAKKSIKWDVGSGLALKAMQYRVTNYEQIWFTNAPYNGQLTTTQQGKDLVFKIKEAVASGNVVVTGGYPSRWQYGKVLGAGELGKFGESIITHSVAEGSGGHQVTIVGYDDNITTRIDGVTLKGAFLMANSWDTSYQNDGYVWVAYDAINTVSEFEELNAEEYGRGWTFDQFCFTYWDRDIEVGAPDLAVEIEVEANNRASFNVTLTREDADGVVASRMPQLYQYVDIHEKYGAYTNFGGDVEGSADTGYLAFSYQYLLDTMPQGASVENYLWGVNIKSVSSTYEAKIKSIRLVNAKGETISQIKPQADNETILAKETNYTFDLGGELKPYRVNGAYTVKNLGNEKYFSIPTSKLTFVGDVAKATPITFDYDAGENNYHILMGDRENYVFDISGKDVKAGVEIKFNARNSERDTQTWKLKNNGDGTYTFYLEKTDADGRYLAFGIKDGKTVLVSGNDIAKYGKFALGAAADSSKDVDYDVTVSGTSVSFKATALEKGLKFTKVIVTNAAGSDVATENANAASFEKTFTLQKGTYTINLATEKHSYIYVVTVK